MPIPRALTTSGPLRAAVGALSIALLLGAGAVANASTAPQAAPAPPGDAAVAQNVAELTRDTTWTPTGKVSLRFPTFHTEGLAVTPEHLFLSSVQVTEPTQKFPSPQGGYDRTPGKGIGHLFVMDRQGNLQKDIVLGEGDMYHPGGIEFDGTDVWVPVAQYRPNSSSIVYRINADTLDVQRAFDVPDHIGGIVMDRATGHLVGNNWGSRRFYDWSVRGQLSSTWDNPGFFVDHQDCQYAEFRKMVCSGVANLPQTPAAGGTAKTYELGGIALIDLAAQRVLREVPFQQWSAAGHVATRNPFKLSAEGDQLTAWAAPDDGEDVAGTELLTYRATVTPTPTGPPLGR